MRWPRAMRLMPANCVASASPQSPQSRKVPLPMSTMLPLNRLSVLMFAAALTFGAAPLRAETRVDAVHVSASAQDADTVKPQRKMTRAEKRALVKAQAEAQEARVELKASVKRASMLKPVKGRIWCVPFAREASGIQLKGNAGTWWGKAAGLYNRSKLPQVGAVMNFASSRKMPMGHVAVVSNVLDSRRIQIDHANWVRNKVTLDQTVIDVSDANDWSQVRVVNADGSLGRVNPVHGFISN